MRQARISALEERRMEAIVSEHEAALLRYAARILHNASAAEDIVQAAFVKLFHTMQDGAGPGDKVRAWLYRVTHNEAVDHIRRESRLRLLHEREAADPAVSGREERDAALSDAEKRALVLEHVRALHPREQQVLLLRLDDGLSYREIGEITGRSEGNVGNILHHAVRKLSRRLGAGRPSAESGEHAL